MKISVEMANDIVWDNHDDFEEVESKIVDHSRWEIHYESIYKSIDGKYYKLCYSEGATEYQDKDPFEEHEEPELIEVEEKEVLVKQWVEKN